MIGIVSVNGGSDPTHLFATERKVALGWAAECKAQADVLKRFGGDFYLEHLPFGCVNPALMGTDSLPLAKLLGLTKLADEGEFVSAHVQLYADTKVPQYFYLGYPGYVMTDVSTPAGVLACISPIVKLARTGVPVRVYYDSILADTVADQKKVMENTRALGLVTGGEPRPQLPWANRVDTPVVTTLAAWRSMGGIPAAQLVQKPILLYPDTDRSVALTELQAGNSVAFYGYPGFPAATLRAALAAGTAPTN